MRGFCFTVISVLASGIVPAKGACTNLTASFSYTKNKSCGLPVIVSFTNTSTGANQNIASYNWYLDTVLIKKTTGKGNFIFTITAPGSYTFKLMAIDTGKSGCKDSISQTIVINQIVPKIKDATGNFTYNPVWENCISNFGVPDTFGLLFQTSDSLKNYTIDWGDGTSKKTDTLLTKSQNIYHKYTTLGQYQIQVVGNNGTCNDTITGLIVNERNPVAGLMGPPTGTSSGCVPMRVRFINNSSKSSPSSKFIWDMGNGVSITQPASTYNDTFYYTYRKYLCNGVVKLTMMNACGSSFSTWNPIQASSKDSAQIKLNNPLNCDLSKDFLFDNASQNRFCSTPNAKKYVWNFGDGSPSITTTSSATIAKKYSRRGTFTITLMDSNTCGKDTTRMVLKIDSLPTLKASVTNTYGCPPLMAQFKDSSINVATRLWNFGDWNISSASNTTHSYGSGGTYKVVISVGNVCGTLKDSFPIEVKYRAKAGIQPIAGYRCIPYVANFVNASTIPYPTKTTFKWIFEDGTTSALKTPLARTYMKPGNHVVTLIAYDSCGSDTTRMTLNIYSRPQLALSLVSTVNCNNSAVTLRYNTPRASSQIFWDHGDGKPVKQYTGFNQYDHTYKFDTAKTYWNTAIIVDSNSCRDTFKLGVVINPVPTADYTSDKTAGCGPLAVKFTNTSIHQGGGSFSQLKFLWNYDKAKSTSTDSIVLYPASKTRDSIFRIQLTAQNSFGCMDSITKNIRVYPKPLSRFQLNTNNGCGPLSINTKNTSIPYDTGSIYIMKFIWNFGNKQFAYKRDSTAKYLSSKTRDTFYTVSLFAFSEHNCADTSIQTVRVYPKPKASFQATPDNGCRPLSVALTNNSIPYDTGSINIMSFQWDLGNKSTSATTNTSAVYNDVTTNDTNYTIRLIALSEHACRDTSYKNILVHPSPVMKFKVDKMQGCTPLFVKFTDQSINATNFKWYFGASATDTLRNPARYLYGNYLFDSTVTVKLTGISKYGCISDSAFAYVTLYGLPKSTFTTAADSICYRNEIQFYNQSLGAISYTWKFGDGTQSTTLNPTHYFAKNSNPFRDSTYTVSLTSSSSKGCKDTTKKMVTVWPYTIPSLNADKTSGCAPLVVHFQNTSLNSPKYEWNFGDGTKYTARDPVHIFENIALQDNLYHVVLTTHSPYCMDTVGVWIRVFGRSQSFFTAGRIDPCDPGYFQFTNMSTNAKSVTYHFADGTTSSLNNPLHLHYPSPYRDTAYRVMMVSASNNGCTDTFNRLVTLPQQLQMGMRDSAITMCNPGLISFRNYTVGAVNSIWDFGDNTISVQRDPVHEYRNAGIYNYKLFAFDGNGCLDSIVSTKNITIHDQPIAQFAFNPGSGRMPSATSIAFSNNSISSIPLNYSWNFSDPTGVPPTSQIKDPVHVFSDSGDYTICLSVHNGSCADTVCHDIRIEPPYPIPDFSTDRDSGCPPLAVQFINSSQYSDDWEWFFGDGAKSTEQNPLHIYSFSGVFNVLLVAKGPGGQEKMEKKFLLHVLGEPFSLFQLSPSLLYLPDARFFTRNNSSGATENYWAVYKSGSTVPLLTSRASNPDFVLQDTGYFDVELITRNNFGCSDTLFLPNAIYVNPKGTIHVPDAFTPTGDNKNDVFKPSSFNVQKENYLFQIFNRWGEKVFETKDRDAGWDGTKDHIMCLDGVYIYKINARLTSGNDVVQEGIVHLLR